jgi:hypothetical protein
MIRQNNQSEVFNRMKQADKITIKGAFGVLEKHGDPSEILAGEGWEFDESILENPEVKQAKEMILSNWTVDMMPEFPNNSILGSPWRAAQAGLFEGTIPYAVLTKAIGDEDIADDILNDTYMRPEDIVSAKSWIGEDSKQAIAKKYTDRNTIQTGLDANELSKAVFGYDFFEDEVDALPGEGASGDDEKP